MNIYRIAILMLIPTLITISSCGGGGGGGGHKNPSEEQGSTGSTTGGTTGGTTTGGGGSSCLSTARRNAVVSFFKRFTSQSPIHGTAVDSSDFEELDLPDATIQVKETTPGKIWVVTTTGCVDIGEGCSSRDVVHSVSGECYTQNNFKVNLTSASQGSLSGNFTATDTQPNLKTTFSYSVPSRSQVKTSETYFIDGKDIGSFKFTENPSGGSSTGGDGSSTGGDDGSVDGSTTGDGTTDGTTESTTGGTNGGTTTGGFSSAMNGL